MFKDNADLTNKINELKEAIKIQADTIRSIDNFKDLINKIINNKYSNYVSAIYKDKEDYEEIFTVCGSYKVPVVYVKILFEDTIYKTNLYDLVKLIDSIDNLTVINIDYTLFRYTDYLEELPNLYLED